jgi:hypothetical protein
MTRIPAEIHEAVLETLAQARSDRVKTINLYSAAHAVQVKHDRANVAVEDIVSLLVAYGQDCCFEINSKSMQQVLYS